jgi:hypothetical protein
MCAFWRGGNLYYVPWHLSDSANHLHKALMRLLSRSKFLIIASLFTNQAMAAFTQVMVEAETVAGGDVQQPCQASASALACTQDPASGSAFVSRSTDGIYLWWMKDASTLTSGSYSVFVRARLSASASTAKNFGWEMFSGSVKIAQKNVLIENRSFKWIRIESVDINSASGQLRMSDWSAAGIDIDRVAMVKDVTVEAELVANGTVTLDPSASGGKTVTRSDAGFYAWWTPPQTEMQVGDYDVHVKIASADGASHNFGSNVKINGIDYAYTNKSVSSLAYEWISVNSFINAGGGQTTNIADYSTNGLKLDAIRLVRKTPYDKMSAAQNMYAAGVSALKASPLTGHPSAGEQILFTGKTADLDKFKDPGGVSIVPVGGNTVYAYFRQNFAAIPNVSKDKYQIYMAISTDGGKTFAVQPNALVLSTAAPANADPEVAPANLTSAYDPQVTRLSDGYYMVFEGTGLDCNHAAMITKSSNGLTGWSAPKVLVCATAVKTGENLSMTGLGPNGSASVPNLYVNKQSGNIYLQWASMSHADQDTQHYQTKIDYISADAATRPYDISGWKQLIINTKAEMDQYLISRSTAPWDMKNTSSATMKYENDYYYMFYDGATNFDCTGQWGLGVMRSANPADLASWQRSARNPFLLAEKNDSCWISYPNIVTVNEKTYVYYQNPFIYRLREPSEVNDHSDPQRTTFRREIITGESN